MRYECASLQLIGFVETDWSILRIGNITSPWFCSSFILELPYSYSLCRIVFCARFPSSLFFLRLIFRLGTVIILQPMKVKATVIFSRVQDLCNCVTHSLTLSVRFRRKEQCWTLPRPYFWISERVFSSVFWYLLSLTRLEYVYCGTERKKKI